MKFLITLFAIMTFALPSWAAEIQMGYDGNLVFEPSEVSIASGEAVTFINNDLPPPLMNQAIMNFSVNLTLELA